MSVLIFHPLSVFQYPPFLQSNCNCNNWSPNCTSSLLPISAKTRRMCGWPNPSAIASHAILALRTRRCATPNTSARQTRADRWVTARVKTLIVSRFFAEDISLQILLFEKFSPEDFSRKIFSRKIFSLKIFSQDFLFLTPPPLFPTDPRASWRPAVPR